MSTPGDLDPQVAEIMKNLGFRQHKIQTSVRGRKYNNIMGMYMILDTTKTKMKGIIHANHQDNALPLPNSSASPSQEVQPSRYNTRAGLDVRITASPANLESRITIPRFVLGLMTATPSLVLHCGPGCSLTTHSSSSTCSSGGAPEGATHENCLHPSWAA